MLREAVEAEHPADVFVMSLDARGVGVTREGGLHRMPIALVADDGSDYTVGATILVIQDWPTPPVLGFLGFPERVRAALDPGRGTDDAWFYFGEPSPVPGPYRELLG